ncbi:hypothetical protein P9112_000501 [Eukaryota sp. TZLM1-RC]
MPPKKQKKQKFVPLSDPVEQSWADIGDFQLGEDSGLGQSFSLTIAEPLMEVPATSSSFRPSRPQVNQGRPKDHTYDIPTSGTYHAKIVGLTPNVTDEHIRRAFRGVTNIRRNRQSAFVDLEDKEAFIDCMESWGKPVGPCNPRTFPADPPKVDITNGVSDWRRAPRSTPVQRDDREKRPREPRAEVEDITRDAFGSSKPVSHSNTRRGYLQPKRDRKPDIAFERPNNPPAPKPPQRPTFVTDGIDKLKEKLEEAEAPATIFGNAKPIATPQEPILPEVTTPETVEEQPTKPRAQDVRKQDSVKPHSRGRKERKQREPKPEPELDWVGVRSETKASRPPVAVEQQPQKVPEKPVQERRNSRGGQIKNRGGYGRRGSSQKPRDTQRENNSVQPKVFVTQRRSSQPKSQPEPEKPKQNTSTANTFSLLSTTDA